MPDTATLFVLILIGAMAYWIDIRKRKHLQTIPPGPRPLPVFGSIFNIPTERPWLTYKAWAEKYGSDILFMDLPRQPTVIINSFDDAVELMEKRSRLYSDRHDDIMDQLTGWNWNLGFYPYGQEWRDRRRNFHQYFNQSAVQQYHPLQTREIRIFLKRALDFSHEVDAKSISLTFTSIILEATYGIHVNSLDDHLASLSQNAVEAFNLSKNIGGYWVEFFPWLRYIPAWIPGSRANKTGRYYKPIVESTRDIPFEAVSRAVDEGNAAPSVLQNLLQKLHDEYSSSDGSNAQEVLYKSKREAAKDAAGVAYTAAVDTEEAAKALQTSGTCWFLIAMSLAPEVQRKAQIELETVLGSRLPNMEDLEALPYCQAVFLEVMRWTPITPLGVYHRLVDGEDDELHGYTIPSGSTVIPNIWAMLQNPKDYPDPEQFSPDRFLTNGRLNPEARNPLLAAFGFGRRICPGRYLAIDSLTLLFSSLLCVFNVESTLPKGDRTVPKATTGLISYPTNVPCRLKPRNAASVALINAEARVAAANKAAGA